MKYILIILFIGCTTKQTPPQSTVLVDKFNAVIDTAFLDVDAKDPVRITLGGSKGTDQRTQTLVIKLDKTVTAQAGQIAENSNAISYTNATLTTEVKALKASITTLQSSLNSANTKITSLQTSLNTSNSKITTLQTSLTTTTNRLNKMPVVTVKAPGLKQTWSADSSATTITIP